MSGVSKMIPILYHYKSGLKEEHEMSAFVRGLKVTTVFGEGIVVNLPVSNRIAVQYESGEIRYFFPEDVITGRIRPAE